MSGFGRILADLNEAGVRYVIVGGIAVIRHGYIRATRDIDAVIAQDAKNLDAIAKLVARWGATRPDGTALPKGAIAAGRDIHLATPHGDLDLLADRAPPLSFEDLRANADVKKVDEVDAPIASLADLVALKRLAGRDQDLLDLRSLEQAHGELPELPPAP